MPVTPRHALTDNALRLLISAQPSLSLSRTNRRGRGALRGGGRLPGGHGLEEEYGLVRLVSITEAYLDAMSLETVSARLDLTVPTQSLLLNDWEIASTSAWHKREDAFATHQGFKLKSCTNYKELMAAVQVRNSIAHGLGRITARQRTSRSLVTDVLRINVTVGGGRMHLSSTTLQITANACRAFIFDVDAQVPVP